MNLRILQKLALVFLVFSLTTLASAQDKITKIKLNVYPDTATIKSNSTAILHAEFFGTKKKGFFDNLLGNADASGGKVQSSKWKIEIVTPDGGIVSKPFLYQKEDQKTKGGIAGFLTQGLGAVSSKDSVLYTAPLRPGKYVIRLTEGSLKEEAEITVVAGAPSSAENFDFSAEKNFDKYLPLVENYAPFVAQETWFSPKADYLARFDYDRNWKGDDNWENLDTGSSQAFVYYAVMETSTHWFLHYNFFHPRDYSDACVVGTCHENDNEGMILTVRKDGTEFGKVELMETLAHNNVYSFSNERGIRKDVHDIDGSIEFYKEKHPIVFIEAGGHGVLGSNHRTSFFDASKMEFKQNTGVTYLYKNGEFERPRFGNDRNIPYALLPIETEWWPKGSGNTDSPNDTFEKFFSYRPVGNRPGSSARFIAGAFKGRTASENMAKPFWGWHDNKTKSKKVLATGQWALDPAYSITVSFKWPEELPVSTDYIYNPFLETP